MLGNISAMFTGKPHVAELGYMFLFRNYDSSLGKWSTSDPLGYPDGWNNFAYCNNWTTECMDFLGGEIIRRKRESAGIVIRAELVSEILIDTTIENGIKYNTYRQTWYGYTDTTYDYYYSEKASKLLTQIEQGALAISAVSGIATAIAVATPGGQTIAIFTGITGGPAGFVAWLANQNNATVETFIETKIDSVQDSVFTKYITRIEE